MENVFYDDLDCLYENLADPCNESQENSTPLASSSVLGANLPQPLLIEKAAAVQLRSPLKSRAQFHQAQPSNLQSTLLTYQETELKELKKYVKVLKEDLACEKKKFDSEHQQVLTLQAERATLVRNISTVYRTAVTELERKNKEIQSLREQVLLAQQGNSMPEPSRSQHASRPHAPGSFAARSQQHRQAPPQAAGVLGNVPSSSGREAQRNSDAGQQGHGMQDTGRVREESSYGHNPAHRPAQPPRDDPEGPPRKRSREEYGGHDRGRDAQENQAYNASGRQAGSGLDSSYRKGDHARSVLSRNPLEDKYSGYVKQQHNRHR